jgi:hypothetical protein
MAEAPGMVRLGRMTLKLAGIVGNKADSLRKALGNAQLKAHERQILLENCNHMDEAAVRLRHAANSIKEAVEALAKVR